MNLRPIAIPAAAIIALTLGAAPARADRHPDRSDGHRRVEEQHGRRPNDRGHRDYRGYANRRGPVEQRGYVERRDQRSRRDDHEFDRPWFRVVAPPIVVNPYREYAGGQRWWRIGAGLYFGVATPWQWAYPAPWYGSVITVAPRVAYGAISLDLTPYDAAVYVDGAYVGRVDDFAGTEHPLTLMAGPHQIDVQAPGYAPMAFNVRLAPGRLIPYRGDLQPLRPW